MGVAGLWEVLRPASKPRSLTELSVSEGFQKNPEGVRGYRLGIDASIWFFHAEYGREGENPVLRTLFFRCATLMKSPFLPLFVFDGPKRPDFKRGKKVNKTPSKLIPGMKQIVEAFGFEHRTAPGEAEAELAYLNRIGVIDGILSDDVDNFLFGATTVIRNPSNNLSGNRSNPILNAAGRDDKNHSWVFSMPDIMSNPQVGLTRGGLILIGLLSGGDYQQGGVERCGIKTAVALARCGFGDTLYQATTNLRREKLDDFLDNWRHELKHEIMTNSRGIIGRKSPSLAKSITSAFPDIDILLSYVNPITSESMGRPYTPQDIRWNKEPDLAKLAATCEFYFEWGYKEAIIKRFRTVIWHSSVLRILRRAVLDLDEGKRDKHLPPSTPSNRRNIKGDASGTPSKMITKYFSSMDLNGRSDTIDNEDDEERLILKIHSARTHVSTDNLPEYRLEVDPAQLVRLAESGIKGTRQPEGPDEWASDEDEDGEGCSKKGGTKAPVDPLSHMRLWMPACMVELVEPRLVREFEEEAEHKRQKKANKGQGRRKATATAREDTETSPPKRKRASKKKVVVEESDADDDPDALPVVSQTKPRAKKTTTSTHNMDRAAISDSDDGITMPSPSKLFANLLATPSKSKSKSVHDDAYGPAISSPRRRIGVKDLTKKKQQNATTDLSRDLLASGSGTMKSFFPIVKPGSKAMSNPKPKKPEPISENTHSLHTSNSTQSKFPSRTPAPFPLSFESEIDSSDKGPQTTDDFFSSPQPARNLSTMMSPSSSKIRPRSGRGRSSTSSSTSSEREGRINKSPRKSKVHASPSAIADHHPAFTSTTPSRASSEVGSSRLSSPTPVPLHTSAKGKGKSSSLVSLAKSRPAAKARTVVDLKSLPVIEISSDEDDEKDLPVPPPPPATRKPKASATRGRTPELSASASAMSSRRPIDEPETPPLLRARARARTKAAASNASSKVVEVIDLT